MAAQIQVDEQLIAAPQLYRPRFVWQMAALALFSAALQVGLFALMPEGSWTIGQAGLATRRSPNVISPNVTKSPGTPVLFHDEVWVSASDVMSGYPGQNTTRASSSKLLAIDVHSGKSRDTGFSFSPSPLGLLVVDDQLWGVAETVVYRIEDGRLIERHPHRLLNQPTRPFIYEGRMAVIDQGQNDQMTLLTWQEGEWIESGRVDIAPLVLSGRWTKPELRVHSDGEDVSLFWFDGVNIYFRIGLSLIPRDESLSALQPENQVVPLALKGSNTAGLPGWQNQNNPINPTTRGWTAIPLSINWNDYWETAVIQGKACVFVTSGRGVDTHCYQFLNGNWKSSEIPLRNTIHIGAVSGQPGYLVSDKLHLFSMDGQRQLEHITTGMRLTDNFSYALFLLAFISRYFVATFVLCLGTWLLMRQERSPHYLYGKRNAVHASILLRSIARGIDSLISVYPPLFWLVVAAHTQLPDVNSPFNNGQLDLFFFSVASTFGVWLGTILVMSYAEGRWGITPGKWLCGIRTFRTTMRPCGMLRAMARKMMIYVDSLFFVTWLPGVLLIAFTKDWQRWGDIVADTIVVVNPQRRSWVE